MVLKMAMLMAWPSLKENIIFSKRKKQMADETGLTCPYCTSAIPVEKFHDHVARLCEYNIANVQIPAEMLEVMEPSGATREDAATPQANPAQEHVAIETANSKNDEGNEQELTHKSGNLNRTGSQDTIVASVRSSGPSFQGIALFSLGRSIARE